jgi:hypothetical protein
MFTCSLHQALVYFEYTFADTSDDQIRVDAVQLTSYVNHAACKLKTEEYDEAIFSCNQVHLL